ncbi:molybdate ABC transporter substrate-binding protein [Candidatus Raskinella chloraquaticus]
MSGIFWRTCLVAATLVVSPLAQAETLQLLVVDIARNGIQQLVPGFEKLYHHQVVIQSAPASLLLQRLEAGERADIVILDAVSLDRLEAQKKLRYLETAELGRAGLGVAVKAGGTLPAVFTEDEFKTSLTAARSIAYAESETGSAAQFHIALSRLKLASQTATKLRPLARPDMVERALASGEIDLAVGWANEFVSRPGIVLAGFLPHSLQKWLVVRAARLSDGEPARAFIDHIADDDNLKLFTRSGFR